MLEISDTRLASAALALGFPGEVHATIHASSRETRITVRFDAPSQRFPQLQLRRLVEHWRSSRFLRPVNASPNETWPAEPGHLMAVAMRAQMAYDALAKAQAEGLHLHLEAERDADGLPMFYDAQIHRDAPPASQHPVRVCDDMALTAALMPLGFQPRISGSPGAHRYSLPIQGRPVRLDTGHVHQYSLDTLIAFAQHGPRRLALEDTQPLHPLVIGYDSLHARALLKKEIRFAQANLLITDPAGTARQALITLNAKGHVHAAVERHFHAPPGSLNL
ncbi:MAG: hypothetical protein KCHDKBKB_03005 [Elusimicrobia bacterium]|nr:hypothetical protein [Elusimicrobiota bacterium]